MSQPPAAGSTPIGTSDRCPTCGATLEPGQGRCGQCKQVFGEANRCPSCGAVAASHEVEGGRLVCAACGATRTRRAGMVVESTLADHLTARARSAGLLGMLFRAAAVGAALFGLSAGGMQAAFDLGSPALTVAVFVIGSAALFIFGGRSQARKAALLDQALERRLLAEVGEHANGVTVEGAARRLAQTPERVDASLTVLAKRGALDLDVDDAGTIRYRVTDELLGEEGGAASSDAEMTRRR